jgi:hypothetical protein
LEKGLNRKLTKKLSIQLSIATTDLTTIPTMDSNPFFKDPIVFCTSCMNALGGQVSLDESFVARTPDYHSSCYTLFGEAVIT